MNSPLSQTILNLDELLHNPDTEDEALMDAVNQAIADLNANQGPELDDILKFVMTYRLVLAKLVSTELLLKTEEETGEDETQLALQLGIATEREFIQMLISYGIKQGIILFRAEERQAQMERAFEGLELDHPSRLPEQRSLPSPDQPAQPPSSLPEASSQSPLPSSLDQVLPDPEDPEVRGPFE